MVRAAGKELGVVGVHIVALTIDFDGKLTLTEEILYLNGRIFSVNFALPDLFKRVFDDAGLKLFNCLVHVELENGTSRSSTPRKLNMSRIRNLQALSQLFTSGIHPGLSRQSRQHL